MAQYGYNLNLPYNHNIHGYSDAFALWRDAKRWRGQDNPRKLNPYSSRRVVSVRKDPDDSIAFRLYETDVVTYHPDNSLTIEPYSSMTTTRFARAYSPSWLSTWFGSPLGALVCVEDRYYQTDYQAITFVCTEGVWAPRAPRPFDVPYVDRTAGRAALRAHGYPDFRDWLWAYLPMQALSGDHNALFQGLARALGTRGASEKARVLACWTAAQRVQGTFVDATGCEHAVALLDDRAMWPALAFAPAWVPLEPSSPFRSWRERQEWRYSSATHVRKVLTGVRLAVHHVAETIRFKKVDYLESYAAARNLHRQYEILGEP
jgi:hypothetical protein